PVTLPTDAFPSPPRDGAAVVVEGGDRLTTGLLAVADSGTGVRAFSQTGAAVIAESARGSALVVRSTGTPVGAWAAVEIGAEKSNWGLRVIAAEGEAIRAEGAGRGILAISKGIGAAVHAAAWADGPGLEVSGPAVFNGQ